MKVQDHFFGPLPPESRLRLSPHVPPLDGLRGLAILAVLAQHFGHVMNFFHLHDLSAYGWIGVDLFFVLSGFLITGILLDTRGSSRFFSNFYARRVLRIWPLYLSLLAVTFWLVPHLPHHPDMGKTPAWYYVTFLQNFHDGPLASLLFVTWSLAIEEQFYLVWPLLVFLCGARALRSLVIAVVVASPLLRLFLAGQGTSWFFLYSNTFTRLDGLAMGALVALWVRSPTCSVARLQRVSLIALSGGALASALLLGRLRGMGYESAWIYSALALGLTGLLGLGLVSMYGQSFLKKLLTTGFLRYTGRISYGLYLIHPAAMCAAAYLCRNLGGWHRDILQTTAALLLCYSAATISWYALESPILRLRSKFQPAQDVLAIAKAAARN